MKAIFAVLTFATIGCAISKPAAVTLAAGGKAAATIVVAPDASVSERFAASQLADFLGRVTGAKFAIDSASKPHTGPLIAVGAGAAGRLPPR